MILDNVVSNWLAFMVEGKLVDHKGLVLAVGWCFGMCYADDGMVGSQYPEWL